MRTLLATLILSPAMLGLGTFAAADQLAAPHAAATPVPATSVPSVSGQVTFLYFNDINKASAFYGKLLAEEPTLNLDWVKIYRLSPSSSVGLVNATAGAHRPSAQKPVMVSLVVDSPDKVDQWYERLKSLGIEVKKPPKTGDLVRAVEFDDTEGYTLEVFAWNKR